MHDAIKSCVASDVVGCSPCQELKDYLAAPLEDVDDVIAWWGVTVKFAVELFFIPIFWFFLSPQHHSIQYSILSKIAGDYLAIQGSAVASECAFSSSGITAMAHHNCLLPETFGALQLLKSAYCQGYISAVTQAELSVPCDHLLIITK